VPALDHSEEAIVGRQSAVVAVPGAEYAVGGPLGCFRICVPKVRAPVDSFGDDGAVGVARVSHRSPDMAEKSLEERLSALEVQFDELDKKWDAKFDAKLKPIRADLATIKHAVGVLLTRLT
jgi:hypothetical protein